MSIKVLYEDNHIIAVVKSAGVLSQGDATGDLSMYEMVKDYIRIKKGKGGSVRQNVERVTLNATRYTKGNVFLGLVHRLDRPVSGIMLFAKTSKGASRLSEQFRNQTITTAAGGVPQNAVKKTYQAIVCGKPKERKGTLTHILGKDEKLKKSKEYRDGQEARLFYEILKSNGIHSLLKIIIEGGKFHQIRSQLSLAGWPILGDVKYGGQMWADEKTIALCATGLSFKAATSDQIVKLEIEIPKAWEDYIK